MSSVAQFKGIRIPDSGFRNQGIRNQECIACSPKSKAALLTLTLGQVQLSRCVGCPLLVLELKSCVLCPSCDIAISPVRQDYHVFNAVITLFSKGIYIICRVIIKDFLIHEQVKTNSVKIKLHAYIVNLS